MQKEVRVVFPVDFHALQIAVPRVIKDELLEAVGLQLTIKQLVGILVCHVQLPQVVAESKQVFNIL